MSPTTSRLFAEHRGTRLWSAIEASINELVVTREISVNTASDYVVGFLYQELVAKKLIALRCAGDGVRDAHSYIVPARAA